MHVAHAHLDTRRW